MTIIFMEIALFHPRSYVSLMLVVYGRIRDYMKHKSSAVNVKTGIDKGRIFGTSLWGEAGQGL